MKVGERMARVQRGTSMLAGAAMIVSAVAATPAKAQDKIDMVLGSTYIMTWAAGTVIENEFPGLMAKNTNGRVSMVMHQKGSICSEHTCVEQANQGAVDFAGISAGNMGGFGHSIDFMTLPYIFKDFESAKKMMTSSWLKPEVNAKMHEEMGFRVVSWYSIGGFRQILQNAKEVRVPADLKGIKIRTTKSPTEFNLMKGWGATAVPYDWAQLYQGLQTGVVQGTFNPESFLWDYKFHEVVNRATLVNGTFNVNTLVIKSSRYDGLPEAVRAAIDKTGNTIDGRVFEEDLKLSQEAVQKVLSETKCELYAPTEAEMKLWREGSLIAWEGAKDAFDPKLVRRVLAEQKMDDFIKALEGKNLL
jgi:TRAP-type C4-dicarboxylate transport system substrate-binding protein